MRGLQCYDRSLVYCAVTLTTFSTRSAGCGLFLRVLRTITFQDLSLSACTESRFQMVCAMVDHDMKKHHFRTVLFSSQQNISIFFLQQFSFVRKGLFRFPSTHKSGKATLSTKLCWYHPSMSTICKPTQMVCTQYAFQLVFTTFVNF